MAWIDVAAENELAPGQMKRFIADGAKRLLARGGSGHFCVDEMCSHEDFSLWFGCIKEDRIKCSLHGSYFDLASGQPLNDPADCPLRTWPVKVEAGRVWVQEE